MATPAPSPELTVVVVSYNTKELTLKALETLYANTHRTAMRVVLLDNDSHDGSADAVAEAFPQVELIRNPDNIGFARANNQVAEASETEWLLLLNPDTETYPNAIDNLLDFAKAHPKAGITGGRTVFPDGSLNAASCWQKMTPWSLFCMASGLSYLFPNTTLFNPEGMGSWKRDSVRQVDIVVGCFLMIPTALWKQLGGFNTKYWMYGEEADLCLRAARLGYKPMITPDAQIMHLVGASTSNKAEKTALVAKAKTTLIRDHWPKGLQWLGLMLFWCWGATRLLGEAVIRLFKPRDDSPRKWKFVWSKRRDWLAGYSE